MTYRKIKNCFFVREKAVFLLFYRFMHVNLDVKAIYAYNDG